MSLVTKMLMFEKYGFRLNLDQLAEALGISKGTIFNQLTKETFPIPTYLDGGQRYADYQDVAAHFDACRKRAHEVIPAEG